jgi:glycosyltransferase A (GT-A) superfamily protein (DUF2064 family)
MIIPRMSKSFSVIFSHGKHHPAEMVAREITRFRTAPAVDEKVAASIQKQAFSARLFSVPRSVPEIRAHKVDVQKLESALGAQLRASWTDLRERAPRLDEIGQRQADALRKLENRGLKLK